MLPTIMSRGPIDLWTRTPRSIAPFSASAPSHHSLSSANFITNIAESDFWYTHVDGRISGGSLHIRRRCLQPNGGKSAIDLVLATGAAKNGAGQHQGEKPHFAFQRLMFSLEAIRQHSHAGGR